MSMTRAEGTVSIEVTDPMTDKVRFTMTGPLGLTQLGLAPEDARSFARAVMHTADQVEKRALGSDDEEGQS